MSQKKRSSVNKDDGATPVTPLEPPTGKNEPLVKKSDRVLRSIHKKPKIDKKIDTEVNPPITLDKNFKFKNNFAPLPVITTDTVIMSPKKPLDKGKAKETTSSQNAAPLPPKIPKEPTAPPAPPKPNINTEDTLMPDANADLTQPTIVNSKEKISKVNVPGNTPKNDFTKIPVTTKFILCTDPSNVPGYTNREKETATDRLHAELVGYEGSRTVTHRKRKLVLAYFKDNETLNLAMNIKTARDGKSPFTIYDEAEINHEITQQR